MFTFENTKEATHLMTYEGSKYYFEFHNANNKTYLSTGLKHWVESCFGVNRPALPEILLIELSRPPGERKEDHTDENGVVTYALQPSHHIELAIGADAINDVISPDEPVIEHWVGDQITEQKQSACPGVRVGSPVDSNETEYFEDLNDLINPVSEGCQVSKADLKYHDINENGKMTPVFTQAMKKFGVPPPVGSYVEMFDAPSSSYVKCEIICHHKLALFIAVDGWDSATSVAADSLFRPIDNRTDGQAIEDAIFSAIDGICGIYQAPGLIKSLISSKKLIIKLKE